MSELNYSVEMKDISMVFNNKIIANDKVNLNVIKGEVHAIVGENGAGKSTLMSILFGIYEPTRGKILINGKEEIINSPIKATQLKIGMVHQHFQIIDIYKLWENIALGNEGKGVFINKKAIITKITEIMDKYNLHVDLKKQASKASVGELQRTEILKLLYREAEILVFDEPSAVLTPKEIDGLLEVIMFLKKLGKTIILITHKMNEIKKVADRATVIRRGTVIGTYDIKTTSIETLSEAMVGRKIVEVKNASSNKPGDTVLKIDNISCKKHDNNKVVALKDFSLELKKGEIVGIAGVEGNGQIELVNAITGMQKITEGDILIRDKDSENIDFISIKHASVDKRYHKYKMSFVPLDRQKHGLVLQFNVLDNIVLQDIGDIKFSNKLGFIKFANITTYGQRIVDKFDVRNAENGFAVTSALSGGNQQKIIMGRELSRESDFIIIFQPTRGVDVGSIEFIHSQIIKAKEEGKAILLVSFELSEIIALSDRAYVLGSGSIAGTLEKKDITYEKLGELMLEDN